MVIVISKKINLWFSYVVIKYIHIYMFLFFDRFYSVYSVLSVIYRTISKSYGFLKIISIRFVWYIPNPNHIIYFGLVRYGSVLPYWTALNRRNEKKVVDLFTKVDFPPYRHHLDVLLLACEDEDDNGMSVFILSL